MTSSPGVSGTAAAEDVRHDRLFETADKAVTRPFFRQVGEMFVQTLGGRFQRGVLFQRRPRLLRAAHFLPSAVLLLREDAIAGEVRPCRPASR